MSLVWRTLEALRLSGSWTENGVTWANQPATAGLAATTTSAQGYREWDVTALVQEMYAVGANHGFLIRDAAENAGGSEQQFHAREKGETEPQLVVRYTPATVTDTIAPATSLDSWPSATTYSTNASFTFSGNEAGVTFECRLDGGSYSECISPKEYTALNPGAHSFAVPAIDPVGNYDATPSTYNWTVVADTTPPVATILSGPPATTTDATASFTFSASEAGATFTCSLDGADWSGCSSPVNHTGLAVGPHSFSVRASDSAGNVSAAATHNWTVAPPPDTTAPVVTISGPPATTSDTSANLSFTANEPVASFECSLDGAAFAGCTSPVNHNGLALGPHSFAVQATDLAGNTSAPVVYSWTVTLPPDTTRPTASITSGPADPSDSATASFIFTGNDDRTAAADLTFECSLDGATPASCTSPVSQGGLTDGLHNFRVWAIDQAGNRAADPATHSWTVALPPAPPTPPETTIDSGPAASTTETSATFAFSTNEAGATFECSWDNSAYAPCASPETRNGLALGEHSFSVRATSSNGTDPSPASRNWTIVEPPDTTAPDTTITGQPAQPTSSTAAIFSFKGTDNKPGAVTFECRLDSSNEAAFSACSSPYSLSNLSVGAHTFAVRAVDAAGNRDASPATVTWTIDPVPDTTPPDTTITAGMPANTTSTNASFSFSATEAGSTFQCSLDGGAFAACTSPKSYSGLSVGGHSFAVQAIDPAGNVDPNPAAASWMIDAPPPTCTAPQATLNASADAWIDQNSASNNYGSDSILKVQAKSNNNFRTLVRFALPASLPPGCVVQSATLRMYSASWKTGRTLQALRINETWAENAVAWSNQPTTIGTAATTTSGSGWRQWTVTAQVAAMFVPGANHGFLIRDATESGGGSEQQFHGREKNDKIPQLVITYTQAPAGVTSAMFQETSAPAEPELAVEDQEAVEPNTLFLPIISQ